MLVDPQISAILMALHRTPMAGDWSGVATALCQSSGAEGCIIGPHLHGRLPRALADLIRTAELRSDRVYGLDELLRPDTPQSLSKMRRALARAGVAGARIMALPRQRGATLALWRRHRDFGAADSARLSALAPHLGLALDLDRQMRTARAQASLDSLAGRSAGVYGFRLSGDGRLIDQPDPVRRAALARGGLTLGPDGRPGPRQGPMRAQWIDALRLAAAGHEIALGLGHGATVRFRPDAGGLIMFLRLALPGPDPVLLAQELGVPRAEARVAAALACGLSLSDTARELGLSMETVRNYSRRLYAFTGTGGQAPLVRSCLTGAAALAVPDDSGMPPPPDQDLELGSV